MINVTKRSGARVPLDLSKFHKVVSWSCEGISGVSASEIELKSQISFFNNIKTSEIQETLIKAAGDLITEEAPNYQYVAGRLINYHLRKQVYGSIEPVALYDHIQTVAKLGFYDPKILEMYTKEEIDILDSHIKHDNDLNLTYAAMQQLRGKYLVKNRVTGQFYETPQIMYMLIAMILMNSSRAGKLDLVIDYYKAISEQYISLPTPVMAGVRTRERQYSSCVLIEADDTIDSMGAVNHAIMKYVSQKAGIGINGGRIRAMGSSVKGGLKTHTGIIPFWRVMEAATRSCSQGGVRNGAATISYPIWHLEVEDLLVLKNNKGTPEARLRNLDYCVQFNKVMYERVLNNGVITLFSPHQCKEMYEAFFTDVDKFRTLYEAAEKNPKLTKKTIPALELFQSFIQERKNTGRIYLMNVDHCNDHGSFIKSAAPIRMTNLCVTGDTIITVENPNGSISEIEIQDCVPGQRVLSRNIKTGKDQYKLVSAFAQTGKNQKLIKITDTATNQSIRCTPEHQVYTINRGYVEAKNLTEKDILQLQH